MASVSVVKRAFRYRFYPTPGQEVELSRTFGCVRVVYNRALEARTAAWFGEQRRVNYVQTSALLTEWKKTDGLSFLNEVSSVPLQQSLRHLQTAFAAFWEKRSRYPPAGRWHVSILVETTVDHAPPVDRVVGVDAGITSLLTLSTGEKITNPRHERQDRERLARAQRALARKEKLSANRAKAQLRVARVHARIADRRRDLLHKLTTRLVQENQLVVIEDLAVRNMVRNRSLARAISDASWSQLRSMLEYKCDWYGRDLVVVDRWFPSSKTCSACGLLLDMLPLRVREWTCPGCGARHDRDVNAARNILAAGQAVTACRAGVRPTRRQSARHPVKPPSGEEAGTAGREPGGHSPLQGGEVVNAPGAPTSSPTPPHPPRSRPTRRTRPARG
ncbi:putative transposase [Saccharothrix ecbatanensis]|uniref:Putative transposase n=1 Tax=Saccharothrix ecbatanensis TaxID=1105145 RepID=A0A7W9M3A9_9PSEU|nr:RNA-guided endonuclease TnpB family protein [Saccharothrix ecbatanensis]MBB5805827.1 putative transposase [Saccharothrix ecbatanensis]